MNRLDWIARLAWIIIAASSIGLTLYHLPATYAYERTLCPATGCGDEFGILTPQAAAVYLQYGITPDRFAALSIGITLFSSAVFCAVAILIFVHARGRIAYLISLALVLYGSLTLSSGIDPNDPVLFLLYSTYSFLLFVSLILGFYLFPNGRFVPGWSRWVALALFVTEFFYSYFPDAPFSPHNFLPPLEFSIWVGALALIPMAQAYRYWRVSNTVERQQTKWVVAGLLAALAGLTALFTVPQAAPAPVRLLVEPWLLALLSLILLVIPITLAIAVLRYRLFAIDIIVRRTLLYALLTLLLATVYFGSVVVLQRAFAAITGQESPLAVVISTLASALIFLPLRSRLQEGIDRRFYRRKYNAEQTLATFAAHCRDETEVEPLLAELRRVLDKTMQPAAVAIWLKDTGKQNDA